MGDRFQLTKDNYEQFCRRIDITDPKLTLTFRHGMEVTRRIGLRYLWIDSICIDHSDDAGLVRESSRMDEIYRNSYCNIAAEDSKKMDRKVFFGRDLLRRFRLILLSLMGAITPFGVQICGSSKSSAVHCIGVVGCCKVSCGLSGEIA